MHALTLGVGFLTLTASLLPLGVLRFLIHKHHFEISGWKQFLFVFVFEVSFIPYAILIAFLGWLNLIYFVSVWVFFYFIRYYLPARMVGALPILCGLMLMVPVSTFLSVSDGHITFRNNLPNFIAGLTRGADWLEVWGAAAYRIAAAVIPFFISQYLMNSFEKSKRM